MDDMDSVAEAEASEAEAEAELEAEASGAEDAAAVVLAGAEAAEEPEPEPTLAQKVWTAGRTWLRATSWPQALRTQPVARVVSWSMRPQTQDESVAWHWPSWLMASVRQVRAHSGMLDRSWAKTVATRPAARRVTFILAVETCGGSELGVRRRCERND